MASFAEAFKAARKAKGPGATFTWNGKSYTTDRADDKKSTSGVKPKARPSTPEKSPRPRLRSDVSPKVQAKSPDQPKAPATASGVTIKRGTRAPSVSSDGPSQPKAPASSPAIKIRSGKAEGKSDSPTAKPKAPEVKRNPAPGSKANVPASLQEKIDRNKERLRRVARAKARS